MAYHTTIAGANALATLDPSSFSISLNILTNVSYKMMIRPFLSAAKALSSKTYGIVDFYMFRRAIGLGRKAIAASNREMAATQERIEQLKAASRECIALIRCSGQQ
ncbi:hypothetical protein OQA88_12581 [Cercophora sp. LCS_1]